jgi:hypothetical protein
MFVRSRKPDIYGGIMTDPDSLAVQLEQLEEEHLRLIEAYDQQTELVVDLQVELLATQEELAAVKASYWLVYGDEATEQASLVGPGSGGDRAFHDVRSAVDAALKEVGDGVVILDAARQSAYALTNYRSPERMYKAVVAVIRGAELYFTNELGQSVSDYFGSLGLRYRKHNPVARSRRFRSHYTISYNGVEVTMEPHLVVDTGVTRDQCLRIYWYVDEDTRRWVIGHIGAHLPDGTT